MTNISLNNVQKSALQDILDGKSIFLTGVAGSGKTTLIKYFYNTYKTTKNIGLTSLTGCSAIILGGSTLHSFLGIRLGNGGVEYLVELIRRNALKLKIWKELDILIIDEISTMSPVLFDKLEEVARRIRHNNNTFGGIQLILCGDFLQLPCVKSNKYVFEAKTWESCINKVVYLTEIMRQTDLEFINLLNEVRMGKLAEKNKKLLLNCLNKKIENKFGIEPTILYPLNAEVERTNKREFKKLIKRETPKDIYEYSLSVVNSKRLPSDQIKNIVKNMNLENKLQLAKNCQVMLLYNLNIEHGLCNGSRGVVIDFINDFPLVKFINGVEVIIDYYEWKIEDESGKALLKLQHIPLKLAYAISIHKSQGMTLDCVKINLENIFEYSQGYVALSRVKSIDGLIIEGESVNFEKIKSNSKAIKYYEKLYSEFN